MYNNKIQKNEDQMNLPYQGISTFLKSGTDSKDLSKNIGFVGLPYDASTTYRSGARMAPNAIRLASMMLTDGEHPVFEIDPSKNIVDLGDAPIIHVEQQAAINDIFEFVKLYYDRHLVFVGGDHLTTLGVIRSLFQKYNQKISILTFDSHCDTWSSHFGDNIGHGTWLRNCIEMGYVDANHTISIGLRSPVDVKTKHWLKNQGGTSITARQAMKYDIQPLTDIIKTKLGNTPTYMSFDIDCLDPAYAPGTGTPEIGGLSTMFVLEIIENLKDLNFIGADVVEVNPQYDVSNITSLAAATILWTYCSMINKTC